MKILFAQPIYPLESLKKRIPDSDVNHLYLRGLFLDLNKSLTEGKRGVNKLIRYLLCYNMYDIKRWPTTTVGHFFFIERIFDSENVNPIYP